MIDNQNNKVSALMSTYDSLSSLLGICMLVSKYEDAKKCFRTFHNMLPYLRNAELHLVFNGKEFDGVLGQGKYLELVHLVPDGINLTITGPISSEEVNDRFMTDDGKALNILRLRELTILPFRYNKKYWLFLDDDFLLGGRTNKLPSPFGLTIIRAIEYMERFDNCGVIGGGSTLIRNLSHTQISISMDFFGLGRGLLLRNVDGKLVDDRAMISAGSGEDIIMWFDRVYKGYFSAVLPKAKVTYKMVYPKNPEEFDEYGYPLEGWHRREVRTHPVYGSETILRNIYGLEDSLDRNIRKRNVRKYMEEKFNTYEYDPKYTLDLSYIEDVQDYLEGDNNE